MYEMPPLDSDFEFSVSEHGSDSVLDFGLQGIEMTHQAQGLDHGHYYPQRHSAFGRCFKS